MTRRKAPPILVTEGVFEEDRGLSLSHLTERNRGAQDHDTMSPSTSEGDSPSAFIHFPSHRKNAVSVDFSSSNLLIKRHKRSASELTASKSKSNPKDIRLPLPLLQEESSSGMSDSERVIRKIIVERSGGRSAEVLSPSAELNIEISRIRRDIQVEITAKEVRKRSLKRNLLKIMSSSHPPPSPRLHEFQLRTWESDDEMSPEPSAQPLPMFTVKREENRGEIASVLPLILSFQKQLRFELTLLLSQCSPLFVVLLFTSQELAVLKGLYGFFGQKLGKMWGEEESPEEIRQDMVDTCYRLVRGRFAVLPHNRISVAVDAVVLRATS